MWNLTPTYLLKCIPRNFACKQSISGPRNIFFQYTRLHIKLSILGSITFKRKKIMVYEVLQTTTSKKKNLVYEVQSLEI